MDLNPYYRNQHKARALFQNYFSEILNLSPYYRNLSSFYHLNTKYNASYCLCVFIFGGSKITADGDCSHEIKRHLLLGRKVMTNLDSIFKSRDITLPTKVHLVKAMEFLMKIRTYLLNFLNTVRIIYKAIKTETHQASFS